MSLAFLSAASASAVARSPMERCAAGEGARFTVIEGWNVAVAYGSDAAAERRTAQRSAGWADVSHLTKLELQGSMEALAEVAGVGLELGTATPRDGAWWCPLTPTRLLVISAAQGGSELRDRLAIAVGEASARVSLSDVTTAFAALTVVGPLATEVLARFTALDLRPGLTPVGGLAPGSIARQPAILIRESEQRYLFLFGAATGEYVWSVVADAGHHLGGRAIGAEALAGWAKRRA